MSMKGPKSPLPAPGSAGAPVRGGESPAPSTNRQIDPLRPTGTPSARVDDFKTSTPPNRITVEVTFEDGNKLRTEINGSLEEVREYYLGNRFNFGDTDTHPKDRLVRATRVELVAPRPPANEMDSRVTNGDAMNPTLTVPARTLQKGDVVLIEDRPHEVESITLDANQYGDMWVHFTNGTFMEYHPDEDVPGVHLLPGRSFPGETAPSTEG